MVSQETLSQVPIFLATCEFPFVNNTFNFNGGQEQFVHFLSDMFVN